MDEKKSYESPMMEFVYFSNDDIFCTETTSVGEWYEEYVGGDPEEDDDDDT